MPLYQYLCLHCKETVRRIRTVESHKSGMECPKCSAAMIRIVSPPSHQATERLDNGAMTRRVERLVDAERLFRERRAAVEKEEKGE